MPDALRAASEVIDCEGRWITPGLIDCHTHLVYAGDRADEFELRLRGASYEEIARAGGGIVSTMRATARRQRRRAGRASPAAARRADRRGRHHGRDQVGYGLDLDNERKQLRAARRLGTRAPGRRSHDVSRRSRAAARGRRRPARYIDLVCNEMMPAVAAEGLADAVDALLRRHRLLARADRARVFEAARALGLPVKLHADQLSNLHGAALAARFGALSADHLEYTDEAGVAAMARGRHGRGAAARRVLFHARNASARRSTCSGGTACRSPLATDCNPGTSPLTSLLLAMNMAATLFRLTVDECLAGVTREAARALGVLAEIGTLEAGKWCDLAIWDIERPAELVYRMGFNPLHAARLEGRNDAGRAAIRAPSASPTGARSIAAPAPSLDPACRPAIAASAAAVERIVARGEPVYGVNTGFGKLASVRIATADLEALAAQHRAVARGGRRRGDAGADRPADDGAQAREPRAGRLGRAAARPSPCSRRCWRAALTPVMPAQGSVGASGDLAPLAHMAAAMIGVGEIFVDGDAPAGRRGAWREPASRRSRSGPRKGWRCSNGTQFSTAHALAALFETEVLFASALVDRRAVDRGGARAPTRRSIRASTRCAAIAARSRPPTPCAR